MANVIPQLAQKKLWRAVRARFIIVLAVVLIVLSICGYLALVPSYLALHLAAPPSLAAPSPSAGSAQSASEIGHAQALMLALTPLLATSTTPSVIVSAALAAKPAGVTVDHITYDGKNKSIEIAGSGTRETINAYRDAAAKDTRFASVSVPVAALVGGTHFSMTIVLAP